MDDGAEAASKYQFLSEEWLAETRRIREELRPSAAAVDPDRVIRMNQVVTDVPFGSGRVDTHLDTSSGEMDLDLGLLDNADVTLTLDYVTAKAIMVEANPQAAMSAFMSGKIKVDGDLGALITILQRLATDPDPAAVATAKRIRSITT